MGEVDGMDTRQRLDTANEAQQTKVRSHHRRYEENMLHTYDNLLACAAGLLWLCMWCEGEVRVLEQGSSSRERSVRSLERQAVLSAIVWRRRCML